MSSQRMAGIGPALLALGAVLASNAACALEPTLVRQQPAAYNRACAPCHERNGFGMQVLAQRLGADKALLTGRKDLPAQLVQVAVRNGIGAMPAMSRAEVSTAELRDIAAFLAAGQ